SLQVPIISGPALPRNALEIYIFMLRFACGLFYQESFQPFIGFLRPAERFGVAFSAPDAILDPRGFTREGLRSHHNPTGTLLMLAGGLRIGGIRFCRGVHAPGRRQGREAAAAQRRAHPPTRRRSSHAGDSGHPDLAWL